MKTKLKLSKPSLLKKSKKPLGKTALRSQTLRLWGTSAALTAALAVISAVLIKSTSVNVAINIAAEDKLAEGSQILQPAVHTLATLDLRYLLAAVLGVSAILSLLVATKLSKKYEKTVGAKISGYRWLYMGITNGLLLAWVSLLAGVNTCGTLKLIAGLVIVTTLFAWLSERENQGSDKKWLAYGGAIFAGVLAWLPLLGSLFGTSVFGVDAFGWYVYVASAVLLAGFTCFAVNQKRQIEGKGQWKEYWFAERNYLAIDISTKVLVVLVVLIGLS